MAGSRGAADPQGMSGPSFEGGKGTHAPGTRTGNTSVRKPAGAKPDLGRSSEHSQVAQRLGQCELREGYPSPLGGQEPCSTLDSQWSIFCINSECWAEIGPGDQRSKYYRS